jgi:hypothetical protein
MQAGKTARDQFGSACMHSAIEVCRVHIGAQWLMNYGGARRRRRRVMRTT